MKKGNKRMPDEKIIESNRVTIRSLIANWEYYYNIPDWQRGPVWAKPKQRGFIRTLLEGNYANAIVFYPENGKRYVLDGQQRLNAIRAFVDGRLGLYSNNMGRYYRDLKENDLNKFLNYSITFDTLHGWSLDGIIESYIAIQNLQAQKASEKQFAYSTTTEIGKFARTLATENPFFSQVYIANEYKGDYSMALYPIAMERLGGLAGMDTPSINALVKGVSHGVILTDAMKYRVDENLTYAALLFSGIKTKARTAVIPIYQSIAFLRLCGYDLDHSESGALAAWFRESVDDDHKQVSFVDGVLHHIYRRGAQETFWLNQLRAMASSPGLLPGENSTRQINRLYSWMYRNGKCIHCGESVRPSHFDEHAFSAGDTCKTQQAQPVNAD
jgi:hypothetical protein